MAPRVDFGSGDGVLKGCWGQMVGDGADSGPSCCVLGQAGVAGADGGRWGSRLERERGGAEGGVSCGWAGGRNGPLVLLWGAEGGGWGGSGPCWYKGTPRALSGSGESG
jgi:hypothetical protein